MFTAQLLATIGDEVEKLAALSEAEQTAYRAAVRNHALFEQKSRGGPLSDADAEMMRHSVDRLKHFRAKKGNDAHKIPSWVHDLNAKPPAASPRGGGFQPGGGGYRPPGAGPRAGSPASPTALGDKMLFGALGGSMAGDLTGQLVQAHLDKRHKTEGTHRQPHKLERALTGIVAPLAGGVLGAGAMYAHHRWGG